ncbi:MAG: hypothetical protein BWZ10_01086 [candidate division BRC1 bacterium ADurb.BinA364]|nr:MAG: hypothetical protein BWZ10_01086 [candidate division BRC1 bacterium ADurb.BinA364]
MLLADLQGRLRDVDAGVVDQDVDGPEPVLDGRHGPELQLFPIDRRALVSWRLEIVQRFVYVQKSGVVQRIGGCQTGRRRFDPVRRAVRVDVGVVIMHKQGHRIACGQGQRGNLIGVDAQFDRQGRPCGEIRAAPCLRIDARRIRRNHVPKAIGGAGGLVRGYDILVRQHLHLKVAVGRGRHGRQANVLGAFGQIHEQLQPIALPKLRLPHLHGGAQRQEFGNCAHVLRRQIGSRALVVGCDNRCDVELLPLIHHLDFAREIGCVVGRRVGPMLRSLRRLIIQIVIQFQRQRVGPCRFVEQAIHGHRPAGAGFRNNPLRRRRRRGKREKTNPSEMSYPIAPFL